MKSQLITLREIREEFDVTVPTPEKLIRSEQLCTLNTNSKQRVHHSTVNKSLINAKCGGAS